MGYIYSVYFEGTTKVYSDTPLSEEDIFDEADSIISCDARTRLDNECFIENFELLDTEEEED